MDTGSSALERPRTSRSLWKTIGAGLALFSMFFGGGNVIFPLLLGRELGACTPYALIGLCVTAVLFPLVGLLAMLLFKGDLKSFFSRIGRWPGNAFLILVMALFGPFGAIPRLVTLAFGTLKPYLFGMPLPLFALLACLIVFFCAVRRRRLIELLGFGLTPLLLLSLGSIIILGFVGHPEPSPSSLAAPAAIVQGLKTGYHTLDLLAALLFAPLLLSLFRAESAGDRDSVQVKRFLGASAVALSLLGLSYGGMCAISAFYSPEVGIHVAPEELLAHLARHILGESGGLVASMAVGLACLTTAISLASVSASYLNKDLLAGRISTPVALGLVLILSAAVASLGFSNILSLMAPVLEVSYPALIVLSLMSIGYKLYGIKTIKLPVAATLIASSVSLFS